MYDLSAVYSCSSDYYHTSINDETILQCQHGVFTSLDNQLYCSKKCGTLPSAENAKISDLTDLYAKYTCDEGYLDADGGAMSCVNGMWQETIGILCLLKCDLEDKPSGVYTKPLNTSLTEQGEVIVTYTCLDDYHPDEGYTSPHSLSCINDVWTADTGPHKSLTCSQNCPSLSTPVRSAVTHSSWYEIIFSCDSDYVHSAGNMTIKCENGSWIGQLPTCSKLCEDPIAGTNSTHTIMGPSYACVVTYTCEDGTHPTKGYTDPYTIVCTDGAYNSTHWLDCELDCPLSPPSIAGLVWTANVSSAAGVCDKGYTLIGQPGLECQSGVWTGDLPICVKHCSNQRKLDISNGQLEVSGDSHNQTLTYTCDSG